MGTESERIVLEGQVIYKFRSSMEPAFRIASGDAIEVRCPDGVHGTIRTERDLYQAVDYDHVNDAVGPIWVDGAEPGDTLKVSIERVDVPQDWGYILLIPGYGLLQDLQRTAVTMIVSIHDGVADFKGVPLPVDACVGTIGVAPEAGEYSTVLPGDHGGNLDTTEIKGGSVLYLPVNQSGALLALGDPKAVMGDGELSGTGIGVPINVFAHVDVLKGSRWSRPVIETASEWQFVASAETLEAACRVATLDAIGALQAAMGWSWQEAYMFASVAGHLRISQVVNPLRTVRLAVPKALVGALHPPEWKSKEAYR